MSEYVLDPILGDTQGFHAGRRHHPAADDLLFLSELNPDDVIDHQGNDDEDPVSSGLVRETCPMCKDTHLRLVLRQHSIRIAHLYCVNCERCYDACYASGAPALTI